MVLVFLLTPLALRPLCLHLQSFLPLFWLPKVRWLCVLSRQGIKLNISCDIASASAILGRSPLASLLSVRQTGGFDPNDIPASCSVQCATTSEVLAVREQSFSCLPVCSPHLYLFRVPPVNQRRVSARHKSIWAFNNVYNA